MGHPSAAKKMRELAQARLARDSARASSAAEKSLAPGRTSARPSIDLANKDNSGERAAASSVVGKTALGLGDGKSGRNSIARTSRIMEEDEAAWDGIWDEEKTKSIFDKLDEEEDEKSDDDGDFFKQMQARIDINEAKKSVKDEGSDSDDSFGLPSWSVKRKQKGGAGGANNASLPFIADFSDVLHNLIAGAPAASAVEKMRSTVRTFMRAWRRVVDSSMRDRRESLEREEMIRKWVKKANHKRLIAHEISLARQNVNFSADIGLSELLTWSALKRSSEDHMDSVAPVGSTHHMQSAFNTKSSHMDSAFQMNSKFDWNETMRSTTSYLSSKIAPELYTISTPRHRRQRKHSRGVVTRNLLKKLKRTRPLLGAMEERMEESLDDSRDEIFPASWKG